MKYSLALFDLDGTLLDTSTGILNSVKDSISYFGLSPLSEEELILFLGCSIYEAFGRYYPDKEAKELVSYFRQRYSEQHFREAEEYDGLNKQLQRLHEKGLSIGVATFKREDLAKRLLSDYTINNFIDFIKGSDAEGKLTKTDIIKTCIDFFQPKGLSSVVMIGDASNDADAAQKAGVDFIGVTYGYGFREGNKYSFPCAGTPQELYELIINK